jgi:hypothetical protein
MCLVIAARRRTGRIRARTAGRDGVHRTEPIPSGPGRRHRPHARGSRANAGRGRAHAGRRTAGRRDLGGIARERNGRRTGGRTAERRARTTGLSVELSPPLPGFGRGRRTGGLRRRATAARAWQGISRCLSGRRLTRSGRTARHLLGHAGRHLETRSATRHLLGYAARHLTGNARRLARDLTGWPPTVRSGLSRTVARLPLRRDRTGPAGATSGRSCPGSHRNRPLTRTGLARTKLTRPRLTRTKLARTRLAGTKLATTGLTRTRLTRTETTGSGLTRRHRN